METTVRETNRPSGVAVILNRLLGKHNTFHKNVYLVDTASTGVAIAQGVLDSRTARRRAHPETLALACRLRDYMKSVDSV